ncbi:hypothetical protein ACI64C_000746, partial [Neisseria gonorrhoeae]
IIYRLRFKALHVPHCHPFKHGFYLTGAQPAPPICRTSGPDSRPRGNDGGKILFFPIIAHNLKFLHSLKTKSEP